MRVTDIIKGEKPSFSLEVFPPKTQDIFEPVKDTALKIAALNPSYMSVTYGAGGGTSQFTADISEAILKAGTTPVSHLSCISSTKEKVREQLDMFPPRVLRIFLRSEVIFQRA